MSSSLTFEEKLNLRSWGLPEDILQKYLLRGVEKMFPWQVECLMSGDVLLGGNLIYSAPTSAGKTLVAEILAIKTVLERRKKVIMILPFVSVVREKMIYFQEILSGSGIRVEGFMGSYNPPGGFRSVHVAICTIEKANNLINRLIEEKNLSDVGTIIVDELHLLGDPSRGYLLELLLTKLKYICQRGLSANIQVIGMSATLPNLHLLSSWMDATLYHTDFRPIPLFEYLKIGRRLYKASDLNNCSEIKPFIEIKNDPGDVVYLCLDTIIQGYSLLVFCPTKIWCETLAVQISSEIKKIGNEKSNIGNSLRNELNSAGISDILEQLKKCPVGLEKNLAQSVSFGVAYHHAGLTLDERDIIEGGFKQNILRVLVATSTLSSGVNLPARRVIIRSPGFQGRCMDISTYRQMIGRAGRMGKDTAGESYIICNESDKLWGKQLINSVLPPVKSCLGQGNFSHSLKRALLEVIASGVVSSYSEIQDYTKCTLLAISESEEEILKAIDLCFNFLQENEFMKVNLDGNLLPSSLAEACLSASVPPDQALYLLRELHKAKQCFVLDSDLHSIYQVTPYSICDYWNVDWMRVFTIWENLPSNYQKVGELVGVEDRFLIKAMRGTINLNAKEQVQKISIHKRFYTALALQDLINEVPLNEVALKYDCNKGMLQSLQQSASTFAAMVTCFCRRLGWGGLEVLLSELSTRIQFGVQKDLLDLLRLDCMTALMARTLFNASITSVAELASSSLSSVHLAVSKAKPFHSDIVSSNNPEKKNVYLHGRPGLSEVQAAELLINEARSFLLKEMGVKAAEWDINTKVINSTIYECSTICLNEQKKSNTKSEIEAYNDHLKIDNKTENVCDDSKSNINDIKVAKAICILSNDTIENKIMENADFIHKKHKVDLKIKEMEIQEFNMPLQSENNYFLSNFVKSKDSDNSCLTLEDEKINECSKSKNDLQKDCLKLDDTELVSSEFVKMITEKNHNKTEPSFEEIFDGDSAFAACCSSSFVNKCNKQEIPINDHRNSIPFLEKKIVQDSNHSEGNKMDNIETENIRIVPVYQNVSDEGRKINLSEERQMKMLPFKLDTMFDSPIAENKEHIKYDSPYFKINDIHPLKTHVNSSTPVSGHDHVDINDSNNDMFLDSPQLHSTMKQELDSVKNRTLDDFDINWGGDSLLEFSQIETKICQTSCEINTMKRKIAEDLNHTNKKMRLSSEEQKSDFQVEQIINTNDISCKKVKFEKNNSEVLNRARQSNSKFLKLKRRSISEGNHSSKYVTESKETNSLSETFLSKAFNATYKLSEILIGDVPSQQDVPDMSDINISDSEDVITGSPEMFQKHKVGLNLTTCAINNKQPLYSSPAKCTPKSSPDKCNSPLKYPPIGCDIIKLTKSPSSKWKSLRSTNNPTETIKSKSFKSLFETVTKSENNFQVIAIGDSCKLETRQIIENIMHSKEVSFVIKIMKICESESEQDKIGNKIMRSICSPKRVVYKFKFGDEAIDEIYFFDGKTIYKFDMKEARSKEILEEVLSLEELTIYGINIKKTFKFLYHCCKVLVKCKFFDVGVAEWILNPQEQIKSLNDLIKEFLKTSLVMDDDVKKKFPLELVLLRDLKVELIKKLKEMNLETLFYEIEMPIQKCLLSMELTGIGFDRKIANDLWSLSTELMGKLEMDAFTLAAQKFSLSSNSDFSKVKKKLKILPENAVESPLVLTVQNWRKLHSLKTKNLSQLLLIKGIRCYSCCSIRSVTGRIIMYDPDLQHIQRDFKIDDKLISLRSAFIAKAGNVLVSADYKQLELRILAHFSRDPTLLPLLTEDVDVFKHISAEWNGISVGKVTEEMRHQVKQICYGIIYGMGDKTLGEALGKTAAESSMLSAHFKRTFPKLNDFIKNTVSECRETGKIKTIAGRVRYLPLISSTVSSSRAQAERQAINSKIQGSAADITKKAMVEIENRLNKTFPRRKELPSDFHYSHLVLQLHDELIYEVSESLLDCFINILRNAMEKTTVLSVPLPVVTKVGKSWGSLKEV